jgi:hypothetical protein
MLFLEGYLVTGMTQLVLCESIHAICFFLPGRLERAFDGRSYDGESRLNEQPILS